LNWEIKAKFESSGYVLVHTYNLSFDFEINLYSASIEIRFKVKPQVQPFDAVLDVIMAGTGESKTHKAFRDLHQVRSVGSTQVFTEDMQQWSGNGCDPASRCAMTTVNGCKTVFYQSKSAEHAISRLGLEVGI
jgi:hypothetical protein